jgi:hypothetical protein
MPASRAKRADTAQRRKQAIDMRMAGASYQQIADRLGYTTRGAACQDVTVSHGRVIKDDFDEPILDDGPTLSAIDRILKIQERRAKFLGLDAPQRHEVVSVDAIDAAIADLNAQLGRDQARETARAETPAGAEG